MRGELAEGDGLVDDGSFHDDYTYLARRGERLVIRLESDDFDAVLAVTGIGADGEPENPVLDDDGGGGTNARVEYTVQSDGAAAHPRQHAAPRARRGTTSSSSRPRTAAPRPPPPREGERVAVRAIDRPAAAPGRAALGLAPAALARSGMRCAAAAAGIPAPRADPMLSSRAVAVADGGGGGRDDLRRRGHRGHARRAPGRAGALHRLRRRRLRPVRRLMRIRHSSVLPACAALLACAAPLGAQGVAGTYCHADSASAAVHDSAYADTRLTAEPDAPLARYGCAYGALSFAVSLPAGWDVEVPDEGTWATIAASLRAPRFVVVGDDPLPEPRTADDTTSFWRYATDLVQGREPLDSEVAAFRNLARDTEGARAAVTLVMEEDARLRLLPHILSAEGEAELVVDSASELRTLAGRRAAWLGEAYRDDGQLWHRETYATVHDTRIYAVSFSAPEADFRRLQPLWRRVLDSVTIETPSTEAPPASP